MAKITTTPELESVYASLKNEEERSLFRELVADAIENEGESFPGVENTPELTPSDAYSAIRAEGFTADEAMQRSLRQISSGSPAFQRKAFDLGYAVTERVKKVGRRAEQLGFLGGLAADIISKYAPGLGGVLGTAADSAQFSGGAVEGLAGLGQAGVLMTDMVASGVLSQKNARILAGHAAKNATLQMADPRHVAEPLDLRDDEGNPLKLTKEQAQAAGEYYTAMAQTPQYGFAVAGLLSGAVASRVGGPRAGKVVGGAVSAAPVGGIVFRDAYFKAVKDGMDEGDAVQYAFEQAGAEFLEQLVSVSALRKVSRSAANKNFIRGLGSAAGTEFASEGATSVAQGASEEAHMGTRGYREGAVESGEEAAKAGTLGGVGGAGLATAVGLPTSILNISRGGYIEVPDREREKREWQQRRHKATAQRGERDATGRARGYAYPHEAPNPEAREERQQVVENVAPEQRMPDPSETKVAEEKLAAEEQDADQAWEDEIAYTDWAAEGFDPDIPPGEGEVDVNADYDPEQDSRPEDDDDWDFGAAGRRQGEGFRFPEPKPDPEYLLSGRDMNRNPIPQPLWTLPITEKPWRKNEDGTINDEAVETAAETRAIARFFGTNVGRDTTAQDMDPFLKMLLFREDEVFDLDSKDMLKDYNFALRQESRIDRRKALAKRILEKEAALGREMNEGELRELFISHLIRRGLALQVRVTAAKRIEAVNDAVEKREHSLKRKLTDKERAAIEKRIAAQEQNTVQMTNGSILLGTLKDATAETRRREGLLKRFTAAALDAYERKQAKGRRVDAIPTMLELAEAARALFGSDINTDEFIHELSTQKDLAGALRRIFAHENFRRQIDSLVADVVAGTGDNRAGNPRQFLYDFVKENTAAAREGYTKSQREYSMELDEWMSGDRRTPPPRRRPSTRDELISLGGGGNTERGRFFLGTQRLLLLLMTNRPAAEKLAPRATARFDKFMEEKATVADRERFGNFQRAMHLVAAYGQTAEGEGGELNPDIGNNFFTLFGAEFGARGNRAIHLAHQTRDWRGLFLESAYWDTLAWDDITKEILRRNSYPQASLEFIGSDDDTDYHHNPTNIGPPRIGGRTISYLFQVASDLGINAGTLNKILAGETWNTKTDFGREMTEKRNEVLRALQQVEEDLTTFLVRMGARPIDAPRVNLRQPAAQIALYNRGLIEGNRVSRGSPRMQLVHEFGAQIQLGLEQRYDNLAIRTMMEMQDGEQVVEAREYFNQRAAILLPRGSARGRAFIAEAIDKFIAGLTDNNLTLVEDQATGQVSIVPTRNLPIEERNTEKLRDILARQLDSGQDPFQVVAAAGSVRQRNSTPGSIVIAYTNPDDTGRRGGQSRRKQFLVEVTDPNLIRAVRSREKVFHGEQEGSLDAKALRGAVKGVGFIRRWRQRLITARLSFILLQNFRDGAYQAPMHMNAGVLSRIPFVNLFVGYWTLALSGLTKTPLHQHKSAAVRLTARHIQTASRFNDMTPAQAFTELEKAATDWDNMRGSPGLKAAIRGAFSAIYRTMNAISVATEVGSRLGAARMVERAGLRNNRNINKLLSKGYKLPDHISGQDSEAVVAALLGMMDAVGGYVHFGDRPVSKGAQIAGMTLEFVNARAQGMAEEYRNLWDKAEQESARGAVSEPLFPALRKGLRLDSRAGGYVYQATLMSAYAALATLAMFLYMTSDEDEDGNPLLTALDDYRSLPEYTRDLYLIFPALGQMVPTIDELEKGAKARDLGNTWKLPTPYGFQGIPFGAALAIGQMTMLDNKLSPADKAEVIGKVMKRIIGEIYVLDDAMPWPLAVWAASETGKYVDNPFADEPFDIVRIQDQRLSDRLQTTGVDPTTTSLGFILNEVGLFGNISPASGIEPWRRIFLPGAGQYMTLLTDAMARNWQVSREEGEFGTNPIDAPGYFQLWKSLGKAGGLIIPNDVTSAQGFYKRQVELDIYARSADKVFGPLQRGRGTEGDVSDVKTEEEQLRDTAERTALGFGDPREEAKMRVARYIRESVPLATDELEDAANIMRQIPSRMRTYRNEIFENLHQKFDSDGNLRTAAEKWEREKVIRQKMRILITNYNQYYDKYFLRAVEDEAKNIRRERFMQTLRQNASP